MTEPPKPGRGRWQFLTTGYYLGGALLLVAFIVIGGRELWANSQGRFIVPGPSASVDSYLEAFLAVQNGSEQCLAIMAKVRSSNAVVFCCPRRDASADFIYYLLAYLTWPQKIEKLEIDGTRLDPENVDRAAKSAFVFFKISPPPGLNHGWPIGPSLLIVPVETAP